jgi:hypothetical protein
MINENCYQKNASIWGNLQQSLTLNDLISENNGVLFLHQNRKSGQWCKNTIIRGHDLTRGQFHG